MAPKGSGPVPSGRFPVTMEGDSPSLYIGYFINGPLRIKMIIQRTFSDDVQFVLDENVTSVLDQ